MKRICYSSLAFLAALALAGSLATSASATPLPNSAIILERLYNNCPASTVTSVNLFPGSISISDSWSAACPGFANGHAWNFSDDFGATSANLGNNGNYKFKAVVTLSGQGVVEGGIHIAPWWQNMDGRFQARIPDGEVACFGGRLPFYSFTVNHGVSYVAGTPITMEIEYHANGLNAGSPASIQYTCTYGGTFQSPVLLFDEGNTAEDPPHGLWGSLDPSFAGGVVQVNNGSNGSGYNATWTDIEFSCLDCPTPVTSATWGRIKALYR